MALHFRDIKLPVDAELQTLSHLISNQFEIPRASIQGVRIVRQALDARRKHDIHFLVNAIVQLERTEQARVLKRGDARITSYEAPEKYELMTGTAEPVGRIVIAGLGPAGLFAAYYLSKYGYKPLVVEQGEEVGARTESVERFFNTGALNPKSNVMFGAGGAGTFSDGKLTSRSKNPRSDVVLKTLADNGAPEDILYKAKPHIGTDILAVIVKNMCDEIRHAGGEIRFSAELTDILTIDGRVAQVIVQSGGVSEKIPCASLVLSIGQAARNTYEMLLARGVTLVPKPFAVGLRVEHPQGLIDRAQFGALSGHPRLGAAEYRLSAKHGNRGVYSFCMCPGGSVIASSSAEGEVVVNGMSVHARSGKNANSAIVVQVGPEDYGSEPLSGVRFQKMLEQRAFQAGEERYFAPAQRMEDFLQQKKSKAFYSVQPSYRPGTVMADLNALLPEFIAAGIRESIPVFARQLKGFDYRDAVLTAVESRTSAPVWIKREADMQSVSMQGLYPVGEGAGYAGGIVSAAIDGLMACERIAERYKPS